jgi:hypothetical protein
MKNLDLLPSDPESFFGLSSPYDRRDLKRAYGKAIRQYNPESHPAEFQLVRDAYERLEKQLRYGKQQKQAENAAAAWAPVSSAQESDHAAAPSGSKSRSTRREVTLEQLAVIDPPAALKKLQNKKSRTPPDYFLLAVLADAHAGKPTAQYLGQLIEGLRVYPADPGLIALATEFLRAEIPDEMIAKIVRFVAKHLRSPLFYMLTEPLWIRLVGVADFKNVSSLLIECEEQISQTDLETRTAFYLRFLRAAIWVAPKRWTQQILAGIESQAASLDESTQYDLEFLIEVRQILDLGNQNKNPARLSLLKAIRLSCQSDEAAAVAQVTRLLSDLGRDSAAVQQAFPVNTSVDGSDTDGVWVSLVHRLVYQLESYSLESDEVSSDRIVAQTTHLLNDLQPTVAKVIAGADRAKSRYKTTPLLVWLVGGSILLTPFILVIDFSIFGAGGGLLSLFGIIAMIVGLLISYFRWLFPKHLQPRLERNQQRWLVRDYNKHWRARLFRFAQANQETIHIHAARIEGIGEQMGKSDLSNLVQFFIRQDAGLCIFSAINTVLR